MRRNIFSILMLMITALLFISCERDNNVQFSVHGTTAALFADNRDAAEGRLDFSRPVNLEYWFDDTFSLPSNASLQISYNFSFLPSQTVRENTLLVLRVGDHLWELPMDVNGVQYAVPVDDSFNGRFSISLQTNDRTVLPRSGETVLNLVSVSLVDRRFGFAITADEYFFLTPFVTRTPDGTFGINVPDIFMPQGKYPQIDASFSGNVTVNIAERTLETFDGTSSLHLPPAFFPVSGQAVISGNKINSFIMNFTVPSVFPRPIKGDPLFPIIWPRENWRDPRFEIFSWDRYPSILIFDFADFAIQSRMLHRLAFYVEKAGFRGRLSHDHEIMHLHGWNAHNYRDYDLARFFDTARQTNFPLLDEEWELERILLNEGIIIEENGRIVPGEGAILSITRQSPGWLRYRFTAHEVFHGLYFRDEAFREFSRRRWYAFSETGRRFLTAFLDSQQYDTNYEFLLINEFMGFTMQQSITGAADYFGRHLPNVVLNTPYYWAVPPRDPVTGTWPYLADIFTVEAEAFTDYVFRRWGLAAGRVWGFRVR